MIELTKRQMIEQALYKSMEDHSAVTLTLYDSLENRLAKGIVMKVDRLLGIKLRWPDDEWDWMWIEDVIDVT